MSFDEFDILAARICGSGLGFDLLFLLQLLTLRALIQNSEIHVVLNVGNQSTSLDDHTDLVGNHLLTEKHLTLASRCYCSKQTWRIHLLFSISLIDREATDAASNRLLSSMQMSRKSSCPTITYEDALIRELEYRKWLEITHPHLLIALEGATVLPKEDGTDSAPDLLKRKSTLESNVPSPESSFNLATVRSQPTNWHPSKKKLIVRQPPSPSVQIPRPNLVPSFWCKICKVDCVTEFNFNSHIGGKKHKAKKLEILGNRNTGSRFASNTNPGPNGNVVSGNRNDEPNVISSSISGPSSNVSSRNRIYGANENGCSALLMNSLQPALQSDDNRNASRSFSSERQIGMFNSVITNKSSPNGAGPSNSRPDENVCSAESSMLFAQQSDTEKDRLF